MAQTEVAPSQSFASQTVGPQALPRASSSSHWWRVADAAVFATWAALVAIVLPRHEPWADEAQAWLIARDLDLRSIWFHEMRYEGTPGLWHTILWVAQHWVHAPYSWIGVIGAVCCALGVAFLLWKSPFPRPLTYLLVFTYVLAYQYAIVARSYNLLPLLVFAAAYWFCDRTRPIPMTLVLILLSNVAVHGIAIAGAFGLCYLLETYKEWPTFDPSVRKRYAYSLAAMALTLVFLFVVLKPTPDVSEFAKVPPGTAPQGDTKWMKLQAVIDLSFFDNTYVSTVFLLLAGAWCYARRKLFFFALSISLLILLYVFVHGRPHHHGTVFLAVIAAFWIAWPGKDEIRRFSETERLAHWGMIALLTALFVTNIWDTYGAMKNDFHYPYCGSKDAAEYIKQVGADRSVIYGYTFGIPAVQAYFDHNIVANIPTTYYHQGLPPYGYPLDYAQIQSDAPEYLVIFSTNELADYRGIDPPLRALGYVLVHYSKGSIFYKRFAFDTSSFFIYRRATGAGMR